MNSFDSLSTEQKVRASLHRSARLVSEEACGRLGLQSAPASADLLAELLYRKLHTYGGDLEAFAKHAKRSTVNAEDVKLLVRRNPSLKAHVSTLSEAAPAKDRRRKSAAPAAAPAAAAAGTAEQPSSTTAAPLELDMQINTTIDLTL